METIHHLSAENQDEAKALFERVVTMGTQFKCRQKLFKHKSFEELFHIFGEEIPQNGQSIDSLLDFVNDKVMPQSMNFASPFAMAFPDAGNSISAISGALLADFLNQNLINWEPCSPVGTVIEIVVLQWLRQLVGYSTQNKPITPLDVGGVVTTGGVASNVLALLYAREKAFPDCMKNGVRSLRQDFAVIVPESIDHYSGRLAAGWLGLGENCVIKVPTRHFKYDQTLLSKTLQRLSNKNIKILAVICYAGDSRSMTCDNFPAIRKLCDEYQAWMHVDGCHGTQLLFSDKLRSKIKGIALADSITFDPHKVMTIPYALSMLLIKNPSDTRLIHRPEDIITGEAHSFGQVTPFFGSRAFNSLKLYMLIKHLGVDGLSAMIEQRHALACLLAKKINKHTNFILINPIIGINSVVFMYIPPQLNACSPWVRADIELLNRLNSEIQQSLLHQGEVWLHNFNIPDSSNVFSLGSQTQLRPLRFMSGNPILTEAHLDEMLSRVETCGRILTMNRHNYENA